MLQQYTTELYEPAARRGRELRADHDARVKALVRWRRHLDRCWPSVAVTSTSYEEVPKPSGTTYRVTAQVSLGDLDPGDVDVQLVYGPIDLDDELRDPSIAVMAEDGEGDHPGWRRYAHTLDFERAGNFGFTVRIVPSHPDLRTFAYLGKVAWAPTPEASRADLGGAARRSVGGTRCEGRGQPPGLPGVRVDTAAGEHLRARHADGRRPVDGPVVVAEGLVGERGHADHLAVDVDDRSALEVGADRPPCGGSPVRSGR